MQKPEYFQGLLCDSVSLVGPPNTDSCDLLKYHWIGIELSSVMPF